MHCDVMPATMSLGHRKFQLHCNPRDHHHAGGAIVDRNVITLHMTV